jgi:hypothetical protein
MTAQQGLVHKRRRAHILAQNPDTPPDKLPNFEDVKMNRSLRRHYDVVLQLAVARRILISHEICPTEIKRGCGALNRTMQSLARMNAHLTPYCHLATHIEPQFLRLGPSSGFGAYPYERNNGVLGRFNVNGHSGGELEGTMMRGWWKRTFIQELVRMSLVVANFDGLMLTIFQITHLEDLPRPWTSEDTDSIELLKSYMKGGTSERRGTLQNYIEHMQAASNPGIS